MTLKNRYFAWSVRIMVVAALTMFAVQDRAGAGDTSNSPKEIERKLINVLQSDAPPQDKAIPCKQLAIYGTKDAVPALAALLPDKELASWARIALEAIPDPAADVALREAAGKLQGRLLIGVINSIGYRRDAGAVDGLVPRLKDADAQVVAAAAAALGRTGGDQAAKALGQALAESPSAVRPAVAEGCILCAETFLKAGRYSQATSLYDRVRRADVPEQRLLEATRGAILARQSAGVSLLIEQLRSADKARFGIGLRTARELEGRDVTDALAAELDRLSPDRQPLLLLAVADRKDTGVLPVVLKAAGSGPEKLRIEAVRVLVRLGDVSSVPVLLDAAGEDDVQLAQTAMTTLARLSGTDVDADLLARFPQATGRMRRILIELAGQRQIDEALASVVQSVNDADAGVRAAAVQAIGILGQDEQAGDLVRLLQKSQIPAERNETEKALLAVCGRWGTGCLPYLRPLVQSRQGDLRMIGLHAMAIVGGPDALATVIAAIGGKTEAVQNEAVRVLSTWPNNWPEDADAGEALLKLARSGKTTTQQVLGLRGYLQYIRSETNLSDDEKVAKVRESLSLVQRPEEKRQAIAVIGGVRTSGAIELLMSLAVDPTIAEEVYSAIVGLTGRNVRGIPREQRQKALQMVLEKSKNGATRKRAEETLGRLR